MLHVSLKKVLLLNKEGLGMKMKMKLLILFVLFAQASVFAENIVLDNRSGYPQKNQKSKIAVQWAVTAREVDEANKAIMHGYQMKPETFQDITQGGKIE